MLSRLLSHLFIAQCTNPWCEGAKRLGSCLSPESRPNAWCWGEHSAAGVSGSPGLQTGCWERGVERAAVCKARASAAESASCWWRFATLAGLQALSEEKCPELRGNGTVWGQSGKCWNRTPPSPKGVRRRDSCGYHVGQTVSPFLPRSPLRGE